MISLLLVDDDEANRFTMSALLGDEGFDVREARSMAEARGALSEGPSFAVVLTDQHLGDGLGSDLVPVIRSRLPDAKIVLMSGSIGEVNLQEASDACFTKGNDFEELLGLIHRLCKGTPTPDSVEPRS
jgi:DNA-binding NtrC family response regulator